MSQEVVGDPLGVVLEFHGESPGDPQFFCEDPCEEDVFQVDVGLVPRRGH